MERIDINQIKSSKLNPRKNFDSDTLNELAESIRQWGVLEPILVRPRNNGYEVVAGERRLRASKLAGLKEVPIIIKEMSDADARETMLIENAQRDDLSDLELGEVFRELYDVAKFSFKQIGDKIGKSDDYIKTRYNLCLKLSPIVKTMLETTTPTEYGKNGMNYTKARDLVSLPKEDQEILAKKIEQFKLTEPQLKIRIKQAQEIQDTIENIDNEKLRDELAEKYLPKKYDPITKQQLQVDIYKKSGVWIEENKFESRLYPILESLKAFNETFPDRSRIKEWEDAKGLKHFDFEVWIE
jgi:ParB family chromosome partitioning protein